MRIHLHQTRTVGPSLSPLQTQPERSSSSASRRRLLQFIAPIALLALLLLSGISLAAFSGAPGIVTLRGGSIEGTLKPGNTVRVLIHAAIKPGWHINSDHPLDEAYIPTRLIAGLPAGLEIESLAYPPAEEIHPDFASGETLSVFSGDITFALTVKVTPAFSQGSETIPVDVQLRYQACDNNECLPPATLVKSLQLHPGIADDSGNYFSPSASTVSPVAAPPAGTSSVPLSDDTIGNRLGVLFSRHSYLLGLALVFLGGLALNLTPCVYPLVGVTIAYFGNQAGSPRRLAALAAAFVLGLATSFSIAGVAAALSGGLFGAALSNPFVLAGVAALLLVLAAASFGLINLQPPQWLMQRAGAARPGYLGAALMGAGMGVVAAPCVGPFVVGLLLLVERSGDPIFGFVLFFILALGLGAPYLVLALAAGSLRRLPRSGEWLTWVESLFGFVLVGLAMYFLDPLVPNRIMTRLLPYYAAIVALYMGFVSRKGHSVRGFRFTKYAVGLAGVLGLLLLVTQRGPEPRLDFQAYDDQAMAAAQKNGTPVLIDFSADWCLPCREMEHTTFRDPAVIKAAHRFVRMRVDLTKQDSKFDDLLEKFGIKGVPTLVLVDSHGTVQQKLVGFVAPDQMLQALRSVS